VLTHIARNADGFNRVIVAADRGEVADQYEGGVPARAAAIEAGAVRPAVELIADVRRSAWALESAWATCSATAWEGEARSPFGATIPVVDIPFRRWREVTLHHADLGQVELGAGYPSSSWPSEYVREELRRQEMVWASRKPMGLTTLPAEAIAAPDYLRLAWLVGRATIEGLAPAGIF